MTVHIASPESKANRSIKLPAGSIKYRRPLLLGQLIHVYYDYQQPIVIDEHAHEYVQLTVLFDPAVCRLRWCGRDSWYEETLIGPQIYLVGAGQIHACHWERDADLLVFYVSVDYVKSMGLKRGLAGVTILDSEAAASRDFVTWQLASVLRRLGNEDSPDLFLIETVAKALTGRVARLLAVKNDPVRIKSGGLSRDRIKLVHDFVMANLHTNIRVPEMARKIGLSVPHFAEVFKQSTGKAPHEYVTDCRMLRAHELLLSGDHRLGETSHMVGYQDQGHFSEKFKKYFGYWPRFLLNHKRIKSGRKPKKSSNRPKTDWTKAGQ